jgi:alpha-amylase
MKQLQKCAFAVVIGFVFATLTLTAAPLTAQDESDMPWWNDRVFYEIFVRSFYDSNGDGKGDLRGVIEKLDYLNDGNPETTDDLGITGIWLMPVMRSVSYHGYDVLNYLEIHPDYGTMDDMRELIEQAHARGIAVIVDLVLNHTARANPWFRDSARNLPEYADWYVWQDEDPAFRGPEGQVVWHPYAGRYFYGVFWDGMPDLNLTNQDVTDELLDISQFWLNDVGVDGFRLDAVKHFIEDGEEQVNTPQTHAWISAYTAELRIENPDLLTVGEVWASSYESAPYVESGSLSLVFEFDLARAMVDSAASGNPAGLVTIQERAADLFPNNQYATFLTNHDQNRVMSDLRNNMDSARVAASFLLTAPGIPFLYYGEEIGMTGVKPDERIRTPMHWDSTPVTAGFTSARRPWQALTSGSDLGITVSDQTDDAGSLLSHYRSLIHLRNQTPALQMGDYVNVESSERRVYAFTRTYEGETVMVLINPHFREAEAPVFTLEAPLTPFAQFSGGEVIFGANAGETVEAPTLNADGGFDAYAPFTTLAPYSTTIIRFN